MTGSAERVTLDPHVLFLETEEGIYTFHRITGQLLKLSHAGAVFLRALLEPDPVVAFERGMDLPANQSQVQFAALSGQLLSRGLCQPVSQDHTVG